MEAPNKKKRPKNLTFPRYKGEEFTVNRNVKKMSINSQFREKGCIIHDRFSYKYNYSCLKNEWGRA